MTEPAAISDEIPVSDASTNGTNGHWPAAVSVAATLTLSLATGLRRLWATDFWWQNGAGRWIAEHGFPHGDPFSFTAAGNEWIELRWIYCTAQAWLFEAFGSAPLVWGKWLILIAAFALMACAEGRPRRVVAACWIVAVAILAASPRFFVRPELSSYLFIAAFVLLLRGSFRRDGRFWLALPILQLLWVNLHPLFFYGPLLIGLAGVAEAWRALLSQAGWDASVRRRLKRLRLSVRRWVSRSTRASAGCPPTRPTRC